MATGLRSITRMSRPITGGVPMGEDIQAAEKVLEPQRKQEQEFLSKREALGKQATESAMGVERAKLEQQGKVLQAGAEAESEYAKTAKDLTQGAEKELEKYPFPQFKPTQEDATTYAQLGSLVATLGMMLGGGAKASSKAAIASMTGMMQGWQAGRRDLWEREAKAFDKEMQRIKGQQEAIYKNLRNSLEQASRDREASRKSKEAAVFIAGSNSIIGKMLLNGRDQEAVRMLESTFKMRSDFDNKAFNLAQSERNRRIQEDAQKRSEQLAKDQIAATRMAAEARAKKPGTEKELKESQLKPIQALDSIASSLESLKKEFKDEYASLGLLGFGADFSLEAKRRLGDEEGAKAVSWWSKYQRLQAPNRHALFGATLTGNELRNYQSFTAKPSDDPAIVRNMLQDQIDYSNGELENKKRMYETAGYKVPTVPRTDFVSTYAQPQPTQADIDYVKKHPEARDKFIARFGKEP